LFSNYLIESVLLNGPKSQIRRSVGVYAVFLLCSAEWKLYFRLPKNIHLQLSIQQCFGWNAASGEMQSVQDAWTTAGGGNCSEPHPPQEMDHQNKMASKQNFCSEFRKTKGNIVFWGCQNILFLWQIPVRNLGSTLKNF